MCQSIKHLHSLVGNVKSTRLTTPLAALVAPLEVSGWMTELVTLVWDWLGFWWVVDCWEKQGRVGIRLSREKGGLGMVCGGQVGIGLSRGEGGLGLVCGGWVGIRLSRGKGRLGLVCGGWVGIGLSRRRGELGLACWGMEGSNIKIRICLKRWRRMVGIAYSWCWYRLRVSVRSWDKKGNK